MIVMDLVAVELSNIGKILLYFMQRFIVGLLIVGAFLTAVFLLYKMIYVVIALVLIILIIFLGGVILDG